MTNKRAVSGQWAPTAQGSGAQGRSRRAAAAKPGEILPLTGIRIFAAMAVVFFHMRGNLKDEFPSVLRWVSPVLDHGDLAVDLFFSLSGFLLAWNYVARIGDHLPAKETARYLWSRLARVWPVYFITLTIAMLWHGFTVLHGPDPVAPKDFTPLSYLRQLFMVVMWTEPDNNRVTWDGPAWSVSCEWLAYLLFPLLALLLFRLAAVLRVRHLIMYTLLLLGPVVVLACASKNLYIPYLWVLRLLGAFVGGGVAAMIVRRIPRTARNGWWASRATEAVLIAIVAYLYLIKLVDRPQYYPVVLFLFVPLIAASAMATGGVARVLSSRAIVRGGHISYSVYLVHMLLIEPIWWAQNVWPKTFAPHTLLVEGLFLSVPVVALALSYLMWRFVEEPARRAMTAMVKRRRPPVSHGTDGAATNGNGSAGRGVQGDGSLGKRPVAPGSVR
nr:acyltransferase [Amycolatopsis sp. SID8362]